METDQAEQLHALLRQSAKALKKNQNPEETDASAISKWETRSPFPF